MPKKVDYFREVQYYETDRMGIVHHANYLHYLEEARLFFLAQNGLSYAKLESLGILSPVLSIQGRYEKSLTYGDSFIVETWLSDYSGLRFSFSYRILDSESRKTVFEGETGHCFLDKAGRPVALFRKLPEIDRQLKALVDDKE